MQPVYVVYQESGQMKETMPSAGISPDFDVRDLADGVGLLAATANVIMQLARPEVGYGVVESKVDSAQIMRHPVRRWRTTLTYLSVALLGTPREREVYRRVVDRSHAQVRSTPTKPGQLQRVRSAASTVGRRVPVPGHQRRIRPAARPGR
jgi:uncharacterized protein (DUF2236 family)